MTGASLIISGRVPKIVQILVQGLSRAEPGGVDRAHHMPSSRSTRTTVEVSTGEMAGGMPGFVMRARISNHGRREMSSLSTSESGSQPPNPNDLHL